MTDDDLAGSRPAPEPAHPPLAPGVPPPSAEHHYRRLEHLAHAIGADDQLPIDPELGPDDASRPSVEHRRPPVPVHVHRAHPSVLASIVAGGFAGTLGRYVVQDAWRVPAGHFPTATFVVNTSGAFLLGLLLTVLLERLRWRNRLVRPFAVTGVLGGWTTYSSLVVESATIGHAGHLALAAGYLALSLLCGVVGVALGIALGRSRQLDVLTTAPDGPRAGTDVGLGPARAGTGAGTGRGGPGGADGLTQARR